MALEASIRMSEENSIFREDPQNMRTFLTRSKIKI